MAKGATWQMPPVKNAAALRHLYLFKGPSLKVGDHAQKTHAMMEVKGDAPLTLRSEDGDTEILVLQGRPIGEPIVQYGPFVMNSRAEIEQAMKDYQRTRFGGWPWPKDDPVHEREEGRFARHADGKIERVEDTAAAEE
jgi:redox-sensitive bicupin YhaK (pirin superfamily)